MAADRFEDRALLRGRDTVRHLLERGLLEREAVVRGHVAVTRVSGRHHDLRVDVRGRTSYLLKQGASPEGASAVAREARVLRILREAAPDLRGCLPRLLDHDADAAVLVLEWLPGRTLDQVVRRLGRFPPGVAAVFGSLLATLHAAPPPARRAASTREGAAGPAPARRPFAGTPPWVLSLHRPVPDDLRTISGGNLDLIRVLQADGGLCARLDALRRDWRATRLVHNDLRWDNVVLTVPPAARRPTLRVVDWELADLGDPAWDLGSALAGWLSRAILTAGGPGDHGVRVTSSLFEHAASAIRSFRRGYADRSGLGNESLARLFLRSLRCAAAVLIQRAYESQQDSALQSRSARALVAGAGDLLRRPPRTLVALLDAPAPRFSIPVEQVWSCR